MLIIIKERLAVLFIKLAILWEGKYVKKGEFVRSRPYGDEHWWDAMDGFFYQCQHRGDWWWHGRWRGGCVGVWWWLGWEVWMGALDIHGRGLIDRMFQCCTSCLVRAASVETPKYLHLVSPLPALVSRILLTRRRNLMSKSALVAEWPKVIQENFAIILLETALQKYLLTREMLKMCWPDWILTNKLSKKLQIDEIGYICREKGQCRRFSLPHVALKVLRRTNFEKQKLCHSTQSKKENGIFSSPVYLSICVILVII